MYYNDFPQTRIAKIAQNSEIFKSRPKLPTLKPRWVGVKTTSENTWGTFLSYLVTFAQSVKNRFLGPKNEISPKIDPKETLRKWEPPISKFWSVRYHRCHVAVGSKTLAPQRFCTSTVNMGLQSAMVRSARSKMSWLYMRGVGPYWGIPQNRQNS